MRITTLLLATFCLLSIESFAQTRKEADIFFDNQNYKKAIEIYQELLKDDPDNYHYNFRLGVCHLKHSVIKSKAIPFLNKASSYKDKDPIAFYLLARAYQYSYQFDPAIRAYEKFIELSNSDGENVRYAKKKIEYCYNAKEFMKFPLNLTFENLGKNINSEYPDFFPFVAADESFIVFNSKRDDGSNRLKDGSFSSNIYLSKVVNGKYQRAVKIEGIGADTLNENVIGLSTNGNLILYSIERAEQLEIYLADFKNLKIENSVLLNLSPKDVLSAGVTATINSEGTIIYLSAELKNSIGGHDIFVAKKLPNKSWSLLQNLGPSINTEWDEKFPNISNDGKTLYFSSEGHTGLGGMDVYESKWSADSSKWTLAKNLGYPLNTPDDEMNFCKAASARHAYISILREEGFGDLDVYRITFGEGDPNYSIVTGNLYSVNKTKLRDDIFIAVIEKSRNRVYGEYLPNSRTGRYVMALPPGEYKLLVEVEGFVTIEEDIEIYDKSDYQTYIYQDMVLKPVGILMALPSLDD